MWSTGRCLCGPLDVVEPDVTGVPHTDLATAVTSALRLE